MEISAIQAEMTVQSNLLAGISINAELVNGIDRHIKDIEQTLNERLVCVSARVVTQDFKPTIGKRGQLPTTVKDDVWESLFHSKTWHQQVGEHEEISFEKCQKGYGFFYTAGEVIFDLAVSEDMDGCDWYVRIIEDRREKHKLTGAPVEVKLRAFRHLTALLEEISAQSNNMELFLPT